MKKMILAVFAAVAVAGSAGAQSGVKYPYVTVENGGVIIVLRDSKGGIDEASLFPRRLTESATGTITTSDNRMSRKFRVQKAQSISTEIPWHDALSYCNDLVEEGKTNWRLPSQRELYMITVLGCCDNVIVGDANDTGHGNKSLPLHLPYIYQHTGFEQLNGGYWAAQWLRNTSYPYNEVAYVVNPTDYVGGMTGLGDNNDWETRCVRCVSDEW